MNEREGEMIFYKVLNEDGSCYHGGNGAWPLPIQNEDGAWDAERAWQTARLQEYLEGKR